MKSVRLFIAAAVSDPTRKNLKNVQDILVRSDAHVKWVEMKNVHVTLKFLGDTKLKDIGIVEDIMAEAAEQAAPFAMELRGLGVFPPKGAPRVVFAGITSGQKQLERIYRVLNDRLIDLNIRREHRDYRPHLTLGRVKSAHDVDGMMALVEENKDTFFGEDFVDEILLVVSDLTPAGPEYNVIGRVPLKGLA